MQEKLCNKCNIFKSITEYHKKQSGKYGVRSTCKKCRKEISKLHYKENFEHIKKNSHTYRINNKEKILLNYQQNKEKILLEKKEYYINNRDIILSIKKENKEHFNNLCKIYRKNRRDSDSLYKMISNIRSLINCAFRNKYTKKSKKTSEILGCTFEEFKIHIENQFDENMNWDNHGTYWQYDHIKPISLARTEQEVIELNHYTNFQPLYWEDNLAKGNKF